MSHAFTIVKAGPNDLTDIVQIYNALTDYLESGINYPLWKKGVYPNEEAARQGIAEGTLYILKEDARLAGTIILNHNQYQAYQQLQWSVAAAEREVMVVHTLAVHPDFMGQGAAQRLLKFADELAVETGVKSIRLDVTVQNRPAIRLYEKCGYKFIGEVDLGLKIPGLELFRCYEKVIKITKTI